MQALLESISRCFGAPMEGNGPPTHKSDGHIDQVGVLANGETEKNSSHLHKHKHRVDDNDVMDARRRQGRALGLELHDQEWDALFHREGMAKKKAQSGRHTSPSKQRHSRSNRLSPETKQNQASTRPSKKELDMDVGYAEVLAKAREAAKPSRHASPRKTPADRKAEIFRLKRNQRSSFASKILGKDGVAKALCFANPVRGTTGDADDKMNCDQSDIDTLNTADDTISSTLYFESKFNSSMETRPPMPLFSQYKVECEDWKGNALMTIVATGSHQSMHMHRLRNNDGTSRRLFVAADGRQDRNDDIQIVNQEIEFMKSEDGGYRNTKVEQPRKERRSTITKEVVETEISIDNIISQNKETPPPIRPISGSQSTALSSTGSVQTTSFNQGNSFTESQHVVSV